MPTTVEFPAGQVHNECKTILRLDHSGNIPITFFDGKTGDDLIMVYLGKEEIKQIVNIYLENHDFIEREGREKKDDNPTTTSNVPQ